LGLGKIGRHVAEKQKYVEELIIKHEDIKRRYSLAVRNTEEVCGKIENQYSIISTLEKKVQILEEKVYGNNESLKNKYKNNFADRNFYDSIKESENSQNACPWTFDEYDMAREELFFASLQVRKAFILESPYIKRNLFVYEAYNNGKYTIEEKKEMLPAIHQVGENGTLPGCCPLTDKWYRCLYLWQFLFRVQLVKRHDEYD